MRLFKLAAALVALMLTFWALPAQAQFAVDPDFRVEDQNGVNLHTGLLARNLGDPTISLGDGSNALGYNGSPKNGRLWDTVLSFDIIGNPYLYINGVEQPIDGDFVLDTVNNVWVLTKKNGDVAVFTNDDLEWDMDRLLSYTYADGSKEEIFYDTHSFDSGIPAGWRKIYRPNSIRSAHGYLIKIAYESNTTGQAGWATISTVKMYNLAVEYCSADSTPCSATALASLTYSRSTNGSGQKVTTIVDQIGRTWVYTSKNTMGGVDYTFPVTVAAHLPGNSTDNIVYTRVTSDDNSPIATATVNGRQWTYSYFSCATATCTGGLVQDEKSTTVTDPLGHAKVIIFDVQGRARSVKDELDRTTTYQYGDFGVTRVTLPEGNYVQYTYDTAGNVTESRRVAKSGSGLADITTSATYQASCTTPATCKKPVSTTDERGKVTDYTYDATHGGVLTVTAPAPSSGAVRPQTRFSYTQLYAWYKNSSGTIVQAPTGVYKLTGTSTCQTQSSCTGSADEVVASVAYQSGSSSQASNLLAVSTTQRSGNSSITATSSMTYDGQGNLLTVDGPLSGTADTARTRYDSARRVIGAIGPDPDGGASLKHKAVRMTYDAKGQVTLVERGTVNSQSDADWASMTVLDQIAIAYDATTGEKLKETLTAGGSTPAVTQYSYDNDGRLECVAQRMNPAIFGSLPTSACTLGTAGSYGNDRISKTTYNAANEVTKVQTSYGTSLVRDEATYTYSSNRQVQTLTNAIGNRTTYEYDGFDRLLKQRYPSPTTAGTSSTTDYEQPTYDAAGNVTQIRLRDGQTISFTYDDLGRATFKNVPNVVAGELDVTTAYDNFGRPTSVSTSVDTLSYGYDAFSRKVSETSFAGQKTMQYDVGGRLTQLSWPGGGFYVNYDYLVTGEVTKVRENGATSGIGVLATYAYDDLGRRTSVTRGNATTTSYGFDAASRLTSLSHNLASTAGDVAQTFSHNPAAEIISQTRDNDAYAWTEQVNVNRNYSVNGLDQYTSAGSITPAYDARGNLTSAGGPTFAYTSENRLASAGSATLTYDPVGRLQQTVGAATTKFDYAGTAMITELDGSNAVLRRYVHGPGVDEPIVWYEGSGTSDRRWLHADERGSVVATSDSSGATIATYSYDEYGVPASTNQGRFQYTGQTWIPEIGMYYYKARIYSPTLGRFLQTDPIGVEGGLNLYAYVGNNPVNLTDPLGLCGVTDGPNGGWIIQPCGSSPPPLAFLIRSIVGFTGCGSELCWELLAFQEIPGRLDAAAAAAATRKPKKPCSSPPISPAEAAAARSGNRRDFWESRAARGDPLGRTGLQIATNSGLLGPAANGILRTAIIQRTPNSTIPEINAEIQQIGVELMRAHLNAVNTFINPTAGDIAQYHFDVFGRHGLPGTAFGGALLTGTRREAEISSSLWRRCP